MNNQLKDRVRQHRGRIEARWDRFDELADKAAARSMFQKGGNDND